MRDHYKTLGVDRNAAQEIINATHRALIKAFHPDVFKGDKRYAEERLKSINAAFDVLGDPGRRQKYDHQLGANDGEEPSESNDWKRACDFFPWLSPIDEDLSLLSDDLACSFRDYIIENQAFKEADKVRDNLVNEFAIKRFGREKPLQMVGLTALRLGHRDLAVAVNRARRLIGEDHACVILERLSRDYPNPTTEVYMVCGLQKYINIQNRNHYKPGLYKIGTRLRFRILPDSSVTLFRENDSDIQEYKRFPNLQVLLTAYEEKEGDIVRYG